MIVTTQLIIEGLGVKECKNLVVGEAMMGANVARDFSASIMYAIGGRSGIYESKLADARRATIAELEEKTRALTRLLVLIVIMKWRPINVNGFDQWHGGCDLN